MRGWAEPHPSQAPPEPPRCTKCNNPPINGQCTNHYILLYSLTVRCCAVSMSLLKGYTTESENRVHAKLQHSLTMSRYTTLVPSLHGVAHWTSLWGRPRRWYAKEALPPQRRKKERKVTVWTLAIAPLTRVRLVTSSALQSRKWQLTAMSQKLQHGLPPGTVSERMLNLLHRIMLV